jgi:hypothetical protein
VQKIFFSAFPTVEFLLPDFPRCRDLYACRAWPPNFSALIKTGSCKKITRFAN